MKINIDEIFDYTSFNIDREPHIVLDDNICVGCDNRGCVNSCPARCYTWSEEDQKMTFVHDGCLECGTCYVVCHRTPLPAGAIPGAASAWPTG